MKLTVLTENTVSRRGLLAEHGLSVLAEAEGKKILFDTGQTDVFLKNARTLGISLRDVDAVVLSHGHYDHGGGIGFAVREAPGAPVYAGKGALEEKGCLERDGRMRGVGIARIPGMVETEGLSEIFPGIFLLGQIPKLTDFEGVSPRFVVNREGKLVRDGMRDEQLLVIRGKGKLHVIAGCCHVGIISCLLYVRQYFPEEPFGMVFAGMHLRSAGTERLDATIEALEKLDVECLVPVHCTGMMAIVRMKQAFGERCRLAETGKVLEI